MILFSQKPRRVVVQAFVLTALVVLFVSGCTTVPKEAYLIEPASRFEYDPQIYFRSSGPVLRDIVAGLGQKALLRLSEGLGQTRKAGSASDTHACTRRPARCSNTSPTTKSTSRPEAVV